MTENGASFAPQDGGKQFVRVRSVTEHFPGLKTFVFEADGVRTAELAPQKAGNYIAVTATGKKAKPILLLQMLMERKRESTTSIATKIASWATLRGLIFFNCKAPFVTVATKGA